MEVKLCSSKINMKPTTFSDFVKKMTETTKVASSEKVVKTAATKEPAEAPTSGQPQAEAKLTNHPKKPESSKSTGKAKKEPAEAPTSGQPQAEAKNVNFTNPKITSEEKTEVKEAEVKKETKPAETIKVARFVKISKLDAKTKTWLKEYWKNLYPVEYVDAMLAEK